MPPQRSIATNVAFNLFGQLAPAAAAAASMPWLLRGLGPERLGVLSLAWVAVGAFTLLDFGLGRSLTLEVARRRATGDQAGIAPVVYGTVLLLAAAGVVLGGTLAVFRTGVLAQLSIPPALHDDVRLAITGVAVAAPFMTMSAGLRGVLDAYGRFDLSNAVRIPLGVLTYLGPALVLPYTTSVAAAVAALAAARVAGTIALLVLVRAQLPAGGHQPLRLRHLRDVVTAGWWMNVAGLAGAALAYVDRLVLGRLVSLSAVAYYATPQELTGKLTVVPVALSGVLLPALGTADARGSSDVVRLFDRGLTYTFLLLAPVAAIGAALAPEWLALWLGPAFARESARAVQWLLLSVVVQSLAITPLNLLQAVGRAHVTAWLQVLQLPLFVGGLWIAVSRYGIDGAAFTWAARMLLDLALSCWMSARASAGIGPRLPRWIAIVAATAVWFVVVVMTPSLAARTACLLGATAAFVPLAWRLIGDDLPAWRAFLSRSSAH